LYLHVKTHSEMYFHIKRFWSQYKLPHQSYYVKQIWFVTMTMWYHTALNFFKKFKMRPFQGDFLFQEQVKYHMGLTQASMYIDNSTLIFVAVVGQPQTWTDSLVWPKDREIEVSCCECGDKPSGSGAMELLSSSCWWGKTMSLNRGYQWAYCSSLRWYMSMQSHSEMI
jgi:hypothetical protein